jgi:hypothetical protein
VGQNVRTLIKSWKYGEQVIYLPKKFRIDKKLEFKSDNSKQYGAFVLNFEHLDFDIVSDFMLHDFLFRILHFWLRLAAMGESLGFIDILFYGGHPCWYRFMNRYYSPPFTYRHFKKNKIIS